MEPRRNTKFKPNEWKKIWVCSIHSDFEFKCYEWVLKLFGTAVDPRSCFETGEGSTKGGHTVSSGGRKHTPAPASALMISSSVMRILYQSKVKAQSTKFQRTWHSRAASLIFNLHWSNLHFIQEKHVMCLSFVFNHAIFYNDVPLPVQRTIISMRQLLWGCQTSAQFQCAKQLNASFPSNAKMTHLPRHDLNSVGRHSSPKQSCHGWEITCFHTYVVTYDPDCPTGEGWMFYLWPHFDHQW